MGFFDGVGRLVAKPIGGLMGGIASAAPQSKFQGSPYQFDESGLGDFRGTKARVAAGEDSTFMRALEQRAMGNAPSAAEMQLQRGGEQNLQQALAMASQRSNGNVGMQQRNAQNALGQINADTNQQAAMMRVQEQAQAMQQFQEMQQYYMNLGFTAEQAQNQANMEIQKLKAGEQGRVDSINSGVSTSNTAVANQFAGSVMGAAAQGGAAASKSDKRAKKEIKKDPKEISEFLDALTSYAYKYKDEKDGEGMFFSPMAQDLEKTSVGKSMVKEGSDGHKMVDYGRGFGAILAAQAELNKRLKKIEGKRA